MPEPAVAALLRQTGEAEYAQVRRHRGAAQRVEVGRYLACGELLMLADQAEDGPSGGIGKS